MNQISYIESKSLRSRLFWLCFIFYFDPGGILYLLTGPDLIGRFDWSDLFFFLMYALYIFDKKNNKQYYTKLPLALKVFFPVWFIYYYVVVGWIIPEISLSEYMTFIYRIRYVLFAVLLMAPVNYFTQKCPSYLLFNHTVTIIVAIFMLITIFTGIELVYVLERSRGFINITRYLIQGLGFISLSFYIWIAYLIFRPQVFEKKRIMFSGLAFLMILLLAVVRRAYVNMVVLMVLILLLKYYLSGSKKIITTITRLSAPIIFVILLFYLFFPSYIKSVAGLYDSTVSTFKGENYFYTNEKDVRLSLKNDFILNIIKKNVIWGTGYDSKWYEGEGTNKDYEGSDYPVLAALSQLGIVGFIMFLPFYLIFFKQLRLSIKYVKRYKEKIFCKLQTDNLFSYLFLIWIATGGLVLINIINYTYLFACANNRFYSTIYFYFALFLGSFYLIRKMILQDESSQNNIFHN